MYDPKEAGKKNTEKAVASWVVTGRTCRKNRACGEVLCRY